MTRLWF